MAKAARNPTILGRQAPRFYLGDAVICRHTRGTEHGVITGIAYSVEPEYAPISDGMPEEVDDWFYKVYVYESDEPGYWENRKKFEEKGFWSDQWLPEFELEPDPNRRIHLNRSSPGRSQANA